MVLMTLTLLMSAATPAPAAQNEAAKLFESGRTALKAKRYEEACTAFEKSYSLEPALGTLLNWSSCLDKQGKAASAWVHLNDAIAWTQRTHEAEREVYARQLAKAIKPRVSWLALSADTELEATLDNEPVHVTAVPFSLPVDRGSHVVRVNKPGFKPFETAVDVAAEGISVSLKLPALESDAPPPPPPPVVEAVPAPELLPAPMPSTTSTTRPGLAATTNLPPPSVGATLVVSGGMVALAGAVGLAWSLSTYGQLQNQRVNLPLPEFPVTPEDYARIKWVYPLAWTAVGVGVAALGVGTFMLVKGRSSVTVVPTVQPGAAGVSLSGQF